jgi:hypothetical protein
VAHDPRWQMPKGKTPEQIYDWAFSLTRELRAGNYLPAAVSDAADITYDNATSGLAADNVQDAIDENDGRLDDLEALPGSGWALIAQNTSPGTVSAVNFNQAAIATSTELFLTFEAVTVTASLDLRVAVSADGGSTFANMVYNGLAPSAVQARAASFQITAAENNSKQGTCHIIAPPGGFKQIIGQASRSASNQAPGMAVGTIELTGTIDYVRLLASASTITGGTIRLYGKP